MTPWPTPATRRRRAPTRPAGRAACSASPSRRTKGITADVDGDADTIDGFTRPLTLGQIVRRIATGRGNLKLTPAQLEAATFTALDAAFPAACGWFWGPRSARPRRSRK